MNVHLRIFADIRFTLMYQRMIGGGCVVKSVFTPRKGGGLREKERKMGFIFFCDTVTANYYGI